MLHDDGCREVVAGAAAALCSATRVGLAREVRTAQCVFVHRPVVPELVASRLPRSARWRQAFEQLGVSDRRRDVCGVFCLGQQVPRGLRFGGRLQLKDCR